MLTVSLWLQRTPMQFRNYAFKNLKRCLDFGVPAKMLMVSRACVPTGHLVWINKSLCEMIRQHSLQQIINKIFNIFNFKAGQIVNNIQYPVGNSDLNGQDLF